MKKLSRITRCVSVLYASVNKLIITAKDNED